MNNFKKVLASGLVLSTLATTAGTVGCFADENSINEFSFIDNGLYLGSSAYQYTPDDTTYPDIDDDDDFITSNESLIYTYQVEPYQLNSNGQYMFSTPDSFNSQLPEYYPISKDEEPSNSAYQDIRKAAPYLVEGLNMQDESTNDTYQNAFSAVPYLVEGQNMQNESSNDAYPDAPIIYPSFDDEKDGSKVETAKKVDSMKKSSKLKKGLIITGAVAGAAAVAGTGYAAYKGYISTDGFKNAIATAGKAGKGIVKVGKTAGHGIATGMSKVKNAIVEVENNGKNWAQYILTKGPKTARLRYLQAKLVGNGCLFLLRNREEISSMLRKEGAENVSIISKIKFGMKSVAFGVKNLSTINEIIKLEKDLNQKNV